MYPKRKEKMTIFNKNIKQIKQNIIIQRILLYFVDYQPFIFLSQICLLYINLKRNQSSQQQILLLTQSLKTFNPNKCFEHEYKIYLHEYQNNIKDSPGIRELCKTNLSRFCGC